MSNIRGTIVISVDDGDKATSRHAAELEKRGLPATFNIITGWVDGSVETKYPHVTVDELKRIHGTGLFEIAGHGDSHKNDDEDVVKGQRKIAEWLGLSEIGFASPGSDMTTDHIRSNEKKYKDMGLAYIRTAKNLSSGGSRYAELAEKARKDGRSDYVLTSLYDTVFDFDSMAVPSVVVYHGTPLTSLKELASFTADEQLCTVFMLHAVRKEGEVGYDSTWSYDFDRFCDFADYLCQLRDGGRVEILTTMDAVRKHMKK